MKRTWSLLGLAAVLAAGTALTTPAHAEGWYIGANGGWNWAQGQDTDLTQAGLPASALVGVNTRLKGKQDDGYAVNGFVGYGWSNGFRTEFEVGYKHNKFKTAAPLGAANGRSEVWTGMANVLYDINLNSPIKPYIGAGIGFANWDVKSFGPRSNTALRVSDDVTTPAWQGIVGLGYDINPNWTVTAEYRYFETPFIDDKKVRGIRNDYSSQMALLGLRYNFGVKQQVVQQVKQAAPAPVVAQAPKSYLVFFDFDRSDLTPEAGNIVRTAAANAKTGNVTRIEVTGHADRSGSDAYNERLSRRRATTVQAELERNGIPASSITVQAMGESQPLVPTPDGVREPQNRRVEIVYR